MAKFIYTNTKNTNTGSLSFKFNYSYYPYILYKKNINFCFQSKSIDMLSAKL